MATGFREEVVRHALTICAVPLFALAEVLPARAHPSDVDVWPTLEDAIRAATAQPLEYLDQLPDLQRRCCVLEPTKAVVGASDVPARLQSVLAEWGFDCQDAQPDRGPPRPIVRWELRPWGGGGLVSVEVIGGPTGRARYRDVPWAAETANTVSRRGAFALLVGRSGWESDAGTAERMALEDATRILVSLESPECHAQADRSALEARIRARLLDAAREGFHQTRQLTTTRLHRVSSRFVVPPGTLDPPAESKPEWGRWRLIVGVVVGIAVVTGVAAAVVRRARCARRANAPTPGTG